MPKELTHWLIADQVLAGLDNNSRLRGIIAAQLATYRCGAVLPDTLLHLFRGPWAAEALELAHSFHDSAGNSFAPLIRAEAGFPDGLPAPLLACLLGVITHIVTDICFHPYVFALTGAAGIGRHYRIETDIDCYFLSTGLAPTARTLSSLVSPENRKTLVSVCALLFDPQGRLPRPALEQALALQCRFQAMYDQTFWKLVVRLLAGVIGSPFREKRHLFYPMSHSHAAKRITGRDQGWRHPVSGELQQSTPHGLAREAVDRCISLFTLIEERGTLSAALDSSPGENLLTGLHGICRSSMDSCTKS